MAKKKKASGKAKKAKGGTKKIQVHNFVMKSKVKEFISSLGCNSSSDVMGIINYVVQCELTQATFRAKANKRKTVRAHDIFSL